MVGTAVDANEWITDRNMFSISGTEDFSKVYSHLVAGMEPICGHTVPGQKVK